MSSKFLPKKATAEQHKITLKWDDAVSTEALVDELAPEVMCGKYRFLQDPRDRTVYHEASKKTRAQGV